MNPLELRVGSCFLFMIKLFPNKNLLKEIMDIAIPVIGGLATQLMLSIIDTAMVGRLENAQIALAAQGIALLASWTLTSFFSSISTGTHVVVARKQGEGNYRGVGNALNNSIILSLILGISFAVFGYLLAGSIMNFFSKDATVAQEGTGYMIFRFLSLPFFLMVVSYRGFFYGIGHSRMVLISAIVTMIIHIVSNFLFIFGNLGFPKLGLTGAGVSSFISLIAGWLVLFSVTFLPSYRITYELFHNFKLNKQVIQQILKISAPISIQNVLILLGFLVFISIVGIIGTIAQAASQVVISTLFISFIFSFGLGAAAQTLVGQSIGKGNFSRAQLYGFETAKIGTYMTLFIGVLFIAFPSDILSLITNDKTIIITAKPLLQIAGLSQILYGAGIILAHSLQAAGATIYVMIVEILTHWFVFLPLTYIYGVILHGGVTAAWWALPIYVLMFLALNYLKFHSKSWVKIKL